MMRLAKKVRLSVLLFCLVPSVEADDVASGQTYCDWQVKDFAIEQPLCNLSGDPERGRALAADSHAGNCLACHQMPIPEESFHGTLGPPLDRVGARYTAAQIRLRIVDEQQINPMTIMPGFYRDPKLANRMADEFWGKTFLTAQQVEDLVAYLVTLK
jgi:sulfur-oxidizing protein SoxX